MQAFRVQTTISHDGTIVLENLPLRAGEAVEVIILVQSVSLPQNNLYPLRGMPITYIDPTEPVAEADWEVVQ